MASGNGLRDMRMRGPIDEEGDGFALFVIGARGYFDREDDPSLDFFYRMSVACAPLRQAEEALLLRHRYGGASHPSMGSRAKLAAQAAPNRLFEALLDSGEAMGPKALAMAVQSRPKQASGDHWDDFGGAGRCVVVDMDFDLRLKGAHSEQLIVEVGRMLAGACQAFARTLGPGVICEPAPVLGTADYHMRVIVRRALAAKEAAAIEAAVLPAGASRASLPRL